MLPGITPPHVPARGTMQVRFFHDRNLEALEKSLNQWLAERRDREIAEIHQSVIADPARGASDREVIVSIWFIED